MSSPYDPAVERDITHVNCLVTAHRNVPKKGLNLSRHMGKPIICIGENKGTFVFCYTDSTISLISKSKISSLYPSSVTVQPGLCRTCLETQIVGFLTLRLIYL